MKKILLLVLFVLCISFSMVSCDENPDPPASPEIDACEWNLISGEAVGSSDYSTVYGTEEAPVVKDNALLVNIKLVAKDGNVTLINNSNDEVLGTGEYVKNDSGIYTVTIKDVSFTCSVRINEYVEWNTDVTGFDGNIFGKYSLDMQSSVYNMLFISNDEATPNCDEGHTDEDTDLICDVCGEQLEDDGAFKPVLRFAITSDVHIRSTKNDFGSKERMLSFIESAYDYAEGEKYNKLDGLFIVGDLTQDGKTAEYEAANVYLNFFVKGKTVVGVTMGNHEFHAYGSGDGRFTPENIAKSTERFKSELGYESEDWHEVINGYHFISIANDSYETRNFYNDETINWLRGEIEAAMADDESANKPIFVMNHEGPLSSVRGFTGGDTKLGELLKNYPRVVDFSGHTHRSILDPQSIWQDGFTAIGTGCLAYLGYNLAGHPTYDNTAVTASDMEGGFIGGGSNGARTGAMYYIVEVDAKNNISLKIYDILSESFYGEPIIFRVGEGEPEVFTPDREEKSVAPVFPEDASIELISSDYNLPVFRFTRPTGGDIVQYYRIELTKDGEREPSIVFYRLGELHNAAKKLKDATSPIRGHSESGTYNVKIYAFNCWGKESLPIEGSITIDEKSMTPDILKTEFNSDGGAVNGSDNLTTVGTPTVRFDEELGRNVATFDGVSGYKFADIKDYYPNIIHSLSIEACFRPGEVDTTLSIGSNSQSGGFGLSRMADGRVGFNIRFNNGASRDLVVYTAQDIAKVGEWVHVVVVYSNSDGVMIYVNGEKSLLYNDDGSQIGYSAECKGRLFEAPSGASTALIIGGDISSSGEVESGFVGDIYSYNLFSRPLSAEDVSELYSSYN